MKKSIRGFDFFKLGLYAFLGMMLDVIYAFFLESLIYGKAMIAWTGGQYIIHWIITSITWGFVAYFIIKVSKKRYGFNILETRGQTKPWQWMLIIISIILSIYISYRNWDGFKLFKEFKSLGMTKFVFQYIYYLFETILITLILVYGQKSFELWLNRENFPYGGIILALTWGLIHTFTKNSIKVGLLSALLAFTFGGMYLLVNRDIKKTFIILYIMFVV